MFGGGASFILRMYLAAIKCFRTPFGLASLGPDDGRGRCIEKGRTLQRALAIHFNQNLQLICALTTGSDRTGSLGRSAPLSTARKVVIA